MTDQDNSYRPRSPDFSSLQTSFPPAPNNPPYPLASPVAHRESYDASPFFTPQYQQRPAATQQYVPPFQAPPNFPQYPQDPEDPEDPDMARRSSRIARVAETAPQPKYEEEPSEPEAAEEVGERGPEEPVKVEDAVAPEPVKSRVGEGIEVKTKFPVARIKRIMQADEDVGKVAQVTPIAVCT